jgi:hypothetical protein
MWHACGIGGVRTEVWCGNVEGRIYLKTLGVDRRMILR